MRLTVLLLALPLAAVLAANAPAQASEDAPHAAGHEPAKPDKAGDAEHKGAEDGAQSQRSKCYMFLQGKDGAPSDGHHTAPEAASDHGHDQQTDAHQAEHAEPAASQPEPHAEVKGGEQQERGEALTPSQSKAAEAAAQSPNPSQSEAQSDTEQPYQLIRTLETVQDKIAVGSREAHLFQRQLLSEIAKKLPKVSDDDWRKPRNSRAGIVYALSGGDPAVLTKLLSLSPLPCMDEKLIKGLLEYSQGRNEEAWKSLSSFDPLLIDPRAGGHLALAQAMLLAQDEPKKAMTYLDMARLLAPGTLVEEAALRREVIFAATVEDFRMFRMLTSQYLRRFNKSVYAGDFVRRFAAAVSTSKYAEDQRLFQDLTEALDLLDPEPRQLAYLSIAKAAIARGQLTLTELTARKLAEFAKDDPKLTAQARLFEAAAVLVTKDYDRAVAELKAVDKSALPVRVQPLLDAALRLAERLRMPPQGAPPASAPPPVSAEQGKHVESQKLPEVVDEANSAIGKADDLMKGDAQ